MGERTRDTSGRYQSNVTDDDVVAAVRAHDPAATSEVADAVDVTRQAVDRRLRRLRDDGRVSSKKIGASLAWFMPRSRETRERPAHDGADAPFNPLLGWDNPQSGQYDIWVGTYSSGSGEPATLFISELGEQTVSQSGSGYTSGQGVDISAPARFGDATLNGGFLPDPWTRNLTAGGSVSASDAVSSECRGYITAEPTVELDFDGSGLLAIYTAGDADPVLAINRPDGSWVCDDDGADGFNAGLSFRGQTGGVYDIYIGTYSQGSEPTQLRISELGMESDAVGSDVDISASALYGDVTLNGGFLPDPWTRSVTAGGPVSASDAIPASCTGMITDAPSVQLDYTGNSDLYIYTDGTTDTVLAVNRPDGSWVCNDDEIGTDAGLAFHGQTRGVYDIYVGTWVGGESQTTLKISEVELGY